MDTLIQGTLRQYVYTTGLHGYQTQRTLVDSIAKLTRGEAKQLTAAHRSRINESESNVVYSYEWTADREAL